MMSSKDIYDACKKINDWEITAHFSVGGFEWLAFSKEHRGKMIIISSQRTTIVDCDNGTIEDCDIIFDETELIAYCDRLPDEDLHLAGQYGGSIPHTSDKGEKVIIETNDKHIMKIYFVSSPRDSQLIYYSYDAYLCGFSYDGDHFVLADDGGMIILKRKRRSQSG